MKICPNCNRKCSPLAVQCPECQTLLFDKDAVSTSINDSQTDASPLFQPEKKFIMQHAPLFQDFNSDNDEEVFTGSNSSDSDFDGYLSNDFSDIPDSPAEQSDAADSFQTTPSVTFDENMYYLNQTPIPQSSPPQNLIKEEPTPLNLNISNKENITSVPLNNTPDYSESSFNQTIEPVNQPAFHAPQAIQPQTSNIQKGQSDSSMQAPFTPLPKNETKWDTQINNKYFDETLYTVPADGIKRLDEDHNSQAAAASNTSQAQLSPNENSDPTTANIAMPPLSLNKQNKVPQNTLPNNALSETQQDNKIAQVFSSTQATNSNKPPVREAPIYMPNRPPVAPSQDNQEEFEENTEPNADEVSEYVYNKELIQQYEYDKNHEFTENDVMSEQEEMEKQQQFFHQYYSLNPNIKKYKKRGLKLWMIILLIVGGILILSSLPILIFLLK